MKTVRSQARAGPPGRTPDATTERLTTFALYEDNGLRSKWRPVSHRGDVPAESGRSYAREHTALEAVHNIQKWVAFRARYFPGRRPRHDFQAAAAYAEYRRGSAPRSVPEVQPGPYERAAIHRWEGEGGATPADPWRSREEALWTLTRPSTRPTG